MTTATIRRVQGEELLTTYFPLITYAFWESPTAGSSPEDMCKNLPYQVDRHVLVMFEDKTPVATAASIHMTQAVRGKILKLGGIAAVATMPQARRKGYARQLIRALYENMRDENEAVSGLYPFRESFYGRLGYVGFPPMRVLKFSPLDLGSVLSYEVPGEIELINVRDGLDTYLDFLKSIQPDIHGMSMLPESILVGARERGDQWLALARHEGQVVGAMIYRTTGFWKELKAYRFFTKNSTGKYLLLQWLARHADQVREIWLTVRPTDFMEMWLYDQNIEMNSRQVTDKRPTPMGRVTIVSQLAGIKTGPGRFSAHIRDEDCPWNNGIYTFETVDGLLTVKSGGSADCELTIQGLSALVFGGYDPGDFIYRGWGNPSPEIQAVMRSMFPMEYPFSHADY